MRIDGASPQMNSLIQTKETSDTKAKNQEQNSTTNTRDMQNVSEDIRNRKYTKEELPISEKAIIDAIEKANKALEGPNKRFEFSIHDKTHEIMVKVYNNDTGEVIREFPPEKILDMVAKIWEMSGLIVDERR